MRQPLLRLPSCSGTLAHAGVTLHLCPPLGPREGKGEAATLGCVPVFGDPHEGRGEATTFDLVPLVGDPLERGGYLALPHALAPEKAGVRQPLLILSSCLGTLEKAEVRSTCALLWAPDKAG